MDNIKDNSTFHLGITMAGAVSAGCYTAGTMDYLYEILDLWERAKEGKVVGIDPNLVPQNKVVIDAMGGTSAGGMATVISTLYALTGNINPVKEVPENPMQSYNILYDSWVHLDDNEKGKSFSKVWDTDDLKERLGSLFNSKVIDAIANRAFEGLKTSTSFKDHVKDNLPKFISPNLELLISHTLLRGIPLDVDFKADIAKRRVDSPKHSTFEHYLISHFKLNGGNMVDEDEYLWLNPYDSKYADKIKLSTISTGAFPVGLLYREFDKNQFSEAYLKSILKRILYGKFGEENLDKVEIDFGKALEDYESLTVDGGAINNEPYREVGSILIDSYSNESKAKKLRTKAEALVEQVKEVEVKEKAVELQNEAKELKEKARELELRKHESFGLIMIDPFPDNSYDLKDYKKPKGLLSVAPKIIQTLWNQSKVKRSEVIEQYDSRYFKSIIYPVKRYKKADGNYGPKDKYPLTSASFGAFGGFLDVEFRLHDFFLGRNNMRNFVQYFGSFLYDPDNNNIHPMHKDWTPEMVKKFKITKGEDKDQRIFLPIIPDMNMLIEDYKSGENRYKYDYEPKPKYDPKELFSLKKKIETRFKKIIDRAMLDISNIEKDDEKQYPISNALLKKAFKKSFFGKITSKIGSWIVNGIKGPAKKAIAKSLTKTIMRMILNDLEEAKILKRKE
ncbi:hypothetical protein [uncultured Croceitalea sp.]|uniref:hypothetical protein n=1 Tax=uncultured Croceitalea sp. TaxID=1798908 RepID=UPI0033062F85